MTNEQIDKIFELMIGSKPIVRENIRTLYLERIGESIIEFCRKYYLTTRNADIRFDFIRFIIRYARTNSQATDLAIIALADRSKKVRHKAIGVLAYSLKEEFIDLLENKRIELLENIDDVTNAINAINAIKNKNHNLYRPEYDEWLVVNDIKDRHLDHEKFKEDIDLYIVKFAPETVDRLNQILGNIYN